MASVWPPLGRFGAAGCRLPSSRALWIGPCVEQRCDGLRPACQGRDVQRGAAGQVPRAVIGSCVDECCDGLRLAFLGRDVQRGATVLVPRVWIGPCVEQRCDGLRLAFLGRDVQRGVSRSRSCAFVIGSFASMSAATASVWP